jgi:hypothetical protein
VGKGLRASVGPTAGRPVDDPWDGMGGGIASPMLGFPAICGMEPYPCVDDCESTLPTPFLGDGGGGRRGGRSRGGGSGPAAAGGGCGDAAERAAGRPVAAAGAAEVARLPHVVVVEVAELGLSAPAPRTRQRLSSSTPGRARGGRSRHSWERRRERRRSWRWSHRLLVRR